MENDLFIVKLDSKYCEYLRQYDKRVSYNYGKKDTRPFVGVLFIVNDLMYFAPLSSPKPKHLKMKDSIDFLKLKDGKLGAINFNNMIPVTDKNIIYMDLNKKSSDKYERNYHKLLNDQLYWLNRNADVLFQKSKDLYDKYMLGVLNSKTKKRCCDFRLLEEKCAEYNKEKVRV